jgi:hypothetical protein
MSIVYQHRRKDNNQVFYVGIGVNKKRAYSIANRNQHWHFIVNKANGFDVDILIEGIDRSIACEIEIGLIKDLGRLDLGNGILVNKTYGGDGINQISEETRLKMKVPKSEIHKKNISLYHADVGGNKNPMYGKGYMFLGNRNPFYGKKHSEEVLEKLKGPKTEDHKNRLKEKWKDRKLLVIKCHFCNKEGGINIKKWHFNNCKHKN